MEFEVVLFLISLGMLISFAFLGIGIVIGRESIRHGNKRLDKKQLSNHNDSIVLHELSNDTTDNSVGSVD